MTLVYGIGKPKQSGLLHRFAWYRRRVGGSWVFVRGAWLRCVDHDVDGYVFERADAAPIDAYERYAGGELVDGGIRAFFGSRNRIAELERRVRLLAHILDSKLKADEQGKDLGKYVEHWEVNELEAIGDEERPRP